MRTARRILSVAGQVVGVLIALLILYGTYLVLFDTSEIGVKAGQYRRAFDSVYYDKHYGE